MSRRRPYSSTYLRNSRNGLRKSEIEHHGTPNSTNLSTSINVVRKSVSKERPADEYNMNGSWLGSKENLGTQKTPNGRIDVSRYAAKSKQSTPLDSHRGSSKVMNNSVEVKEFDRIPTIHDRFEKRRDTSDVMMPTSLGKYEPIQNDRLNSFRNKCKEYEKQTSSIRMVPQQHGQEDISSTRKMNSPSDKEISDINLIQNLSKTKMKNSSNSSGTDLGASKELNVNDLQFLFSKKLSNVDKLSLLKLKKKKDESSSSRLREDGHMPLGGQQVLQQSTTILVNPASGHLARDSSINERSTSNLGERKSSARNGSVNTRETLKSRENSSRPNPTVTSVSSASISAGNQFPSSTMLPSHYVGSNHHSNMNSGLPSIQYLERTPPTAGGMAQMGASRIQTSAGVSIQLRPASGYTAGGDISSSSIGMGAHSHNLAHYHPVDQYHQARPAEITPRRDLGTSGGSRNLLVPASKSQREKEIEELARKNTRFEKEEKERKLRELENRLKNKRSSVPDENDADQMAREFDFNMDMKKISMTPDISRRGSLDNIKKKQDGPKKELDLNSRLILNTLISEVGKTEEQYLETLEFERKNLIDYIENTIQTTGKPPRTSLQFYKILKMIGKGSFGKVHLGIHILSKKKVAIKCIDKTYIKEEKAQKKIVQEVKILRSLTHRNIIKILEVFENKKFVFIVTDYASRGDLLKYMKEHGVFKEHRAKPIVAQILKSLEYCHSKAILHRDIKLDNILLDKDMQVKLCDFGVSRYMSDEKIKERCGTPAYIAPEIINGGGYSKFQADIWSLGVLMYALTTGTIPFKAKNIPDLHKLILKSDFDFPEGVELSQSFKTLIRLMLVKEPDQRITLEEIWNHKWLEGFTHMRSKNTASEIDEYVLDQVYAKMEKLGFPRAKIIESVQMQQMNHISATFYLYTRKLI